MLLFVGCNKVLMNSEDYIKNISSETDFEIPIMNEGIIIFIKKNDKIYQTTIRRLYEDFSNRNKSNMSFEKYLTEVINKDFLSVDQLNNLSFFQSTLDTEFFKKNKKNDIDILKEKFCINTGYKTYIKNNLNQDEEITLCYIFFKNNYFIVFDDLEGIFLIEKSTS